eukprot:scaffold75484_cov44-Cyclotella_meneghiniana.AAC.4
MQQIQESVVALWIGYASTTNHRAYLLQQTVGSCAFYNQCAHRAQQMIPYKTPQGSTIESEGCGLIGPRDNNDM